MIVSEIKKNLQKIGLQLASTAQAAGRLPEAVKLIAVSKFQSINAIEEAYQAGQLLFGENYVQEMVDKHKALPADIQWHLIGHLQKNKVKYIAPFVSLIHTLDSVGLLQEIDKQAKKVERMISCLVQVQLSDEETKTGASPTEAQDILSASAKHPNVRICGLMGMASFTEDVEQVRKEFRQLKTYQTEWKHLEGDTVSLKELSMGMSGDFELAIQEGATMVRIGSAIFGSRKPT